MKLPSEKTEALSDSELLLASGGGDAEAFRHLYRRLARTLYAAAYKFVGNKADAEELMQETFMELWKNAPRYDAERAQPLTFATRIIRNRAIDRIRKKTRRDAIVSRSSEDILAASQSSDPPDVAESAHFGESAQAVRAAFEKLNGDQRTALELAYYKGMSQTEIAAAQSEALGTVKSRIRRGLDKLRQELGGSHG